jgi:hypothetical protein
LSSLRTRNSGYGPALPDTARHDAKVVREVLLQAVDSTVETLLRTSAHPPESGKLSALLDNLASELRDAPALSDEAVSRAGIYADPS